MNRNVSKPDILLLFDIDGTLTESRKVIVPEMKEFLYNQVKPLVRIGTVGGSDFPKMLEQLGTDAVESFDYINTENGMVAYKYGKELKSSTFINMLDGGEEELKEFINWCLIYIAKIDLPIKRGTFVEFRKGMLNICPIGRNCSQEERNEFGKLDEKLKIREKMVSEINKAFPNTNLKCSIGGQISFDVFPEGCDKTFCLRNLKEESFKEIHFFGDKTYEGGNDYEIYHHPNVIGHAVTSWQDTKKQVSELLGL